MHHSIFLHNPSKTLLHHHHRHTLLRHMGGGPRTFPGGLNKWQWKRMHEKKAREKEKRLLDQEKQVYQARVRSQIRAHLDNPGTGPENPDGNRPDYGPLSPMDHVKALADRFMKEGAEDLWNEADGPVEVPTDKGGNLGRVIDLERLVSENRGSVGGRSEFLGSRGGDGLTKSRGFSSYARWGGDMNVYSRANGAKPIELVNEKCGLIGGRSEYLGSRGGGGLTNSRGFCSYVGRGADVMRYSRGNCNGVELVGSSIGMSTVLNLRRFYYMGATSKTLNMGRNAASSVIADGLDSKLRSTSGGRAKWPRFRGGKMDLSDDDDSDDCDEGGERDARKNVGSSAALGKYDIKIKKRIPLKLLEDEVDLSEQVEAVRKEFNERNNMQENETEKAEEESILSSKRFNECDISPLTVRALTEAGYLQMTSVQEATLSACIEGKDVLVKARAGTGKSIAFLLPAIETVLKASNDNKSQRVSPIHVLILCPTRELASQICAEANVLLKHHDGIGVQPLIGGTRFKVDQRRLESDSCQIIVATPGRLLDHIENKSGISLRLMRLQMLVLDEADHLLSLGFRKDIEKLVDCLPRSRQSLLFSATIPKEVRRVSQLVLKREHVYIDTLGLGCLETHAKVKQLFLVAPHDQHFQIVHHLLKSHISQTPDYKVVVFCATAMMTSFMFSLLQEMKLNVREIHSKKPQLYRTRVSDEFKESKGLILITSDVSSRGMNYPDVTSVIQVGIPTDRGQYIHRLGRTGRQGKKGEGVLLLAPWEHYFLDEIKDHPLEKCPSPNFDPDVKVKIEESMEKIDESVKEAAYHSWLGYYNSIGPIGRDKTSLVEYANQFSASIGLQKPPPLFRKTAIKMGLKDVPGIRIRK